MQKLTLQRLVIIFFSILVISCGKDGGGDENPPIDNLARGADVSWLTEMEQAGKKFRNSAGVEQDLFLILKGMNVNAIRLRVWVNPADSWNNLQDVVAKARRAKAEGFKIFLNFHYSDSWADPGQQNKPAAWIGQDLAALKTSVTNHTKQVLAALKAEGISCEWVQVGNETNDGMLWPEGRASINMSNFAELINAGYDAVKAESPASKVVVHISNGHDNNLFRWIFDGLKNNNARYDVIGMSLYPEPTNIQPIASQAYSNMQDMIARYNKEIMVAEVGMGWVYSAVCRDFLNDIIQKLKSLPNNKGLGVFYWEPQAYANWKGYTKGAFDDSGKPTAALTAFQ